MKWFQQKKTVHQLHVSLAFSFSKPIWDQSWLTYPVARNTNTDNNTQNAICRFAEGGGQEKCAERKKKWIATFLCECFPWDILNKYTQQLHDSELWEQVREKKGGCGALGLCILTSESPLLKSFLSHQAENHSTENHIYPHYRSSTLNPPRRKRSKANPLWTASLTLTRFVSMAVFHSYTSKKKGLHFQSHPNPGLSLRSIRALCKRRVPQKQPNSTALNS